VRIVSTKNEAVNRLKMLIYGRPGVGKTRLAATIGEPTLLISAESGHLVLADSDIDMIDLSVDENGAVVPKERRFDQLQKAYKFVATDEKARQKYKWIYIDSISEIGESILESLSARPEFSSRKMILPMYQEYTKIIRSLIKSFRDLPYYNVVFTALLEDKDDGDAKSRPNRALIPGQKVPDQIGGFFDLYLQMAIMKDKKGDEQRVLITQGSTAFEAKDRSSKLEKYEKPNLAEIARKIRGEKQ
jgi:phage nucleotide-binding protein